MGNGTEIRRCELCGSAARRRLCVRCEAAVVDRINDDGAVGRITRRTNAAVSEGRATQLDERRLERLSPTERFFVEVLLEAGERAGEPVSLADAIREVSDVGGRVRARRGEPL